MTVLAHRPVECHATEKISRQPIWACVRMPSRNRRSAAHRRPWWVAGMTRNAVRHWWNAPGGTTTVSPVPLNRTMTDQDILIANTYSKSTLRAVVGAIVDRHDNVFYVPSYERVMLSKDSSIWRPDLRHVVDDFVGTIASSFAAAALGRSAGSMDELLAFDQALQEGRVDDAEAALQSLGPKALETSLFPVITSAGVRLIDGEPETICGTLRELAAGATVQRVAGDLGYESTTAFIVMFRKALGTTPSRYFVDRLSSAERA